MMRALLLIATIALLATACRDGESDQPPKPIPTPVELADAAPEFTHADPAFEPELGPERSTAIWGELGGAVYQIEMPKDWNGRLVVFLKNPPFTSDRPARVDSPENRRALIRAGYAWASSSYGDFSPSAERQMYETAAVWDEFVRQFGRPTYTYLLGMKNGGAAALMSAERFPDRYDGALTMCSTDEIPARNERDLSYFVAAAFAVGMTQDEFDAIVRDDPDSLANTIIARMGGDEQQRFEELWIGLSGGQRPLAPETFNEARNFFIRRGAFLASGSYVDNVDAEYALGLDSISDRDFNENVIRVADTTGFAFSRLSGDIQIPVLMMSTTGGHPPIVEQQDIRRRIEAAGKGDLLVQRTVETSEDCDFSAAEYDTAFADLVRWAETGDKPTGEDLLDGDLSDIGTEFSSAPHTGSRAGTELFDQAGGAWVSGRLWVYGEERTYPFIFVLVEQDGLISECRLDYSVIDDSVRAGEPYLPMPLASWDIKTGCGRTGADIFYSIGIASDDPNGTLLDSLNTTRWPEDAASTVEANGWFDAENPHPQGRYTTINGDLVDDEGDRLPPGTEVEAYIGDTLCGRSSIARIATRFYHLNITISGPDLRPGCEEGAEIEFRVNGKRARVDGDPILNDFDDDGPLVDIIAED